MLERDKTEIIRDAERERKKILEDFAQKEIDLRVKVLKQEGKLYEARNLELEAEFKDLFKRLEIEGDEAGKSLAEKIINRERFEAQFAQISEQMSKLSNLEGINLESVKLGILGSEESELQIQAIRAKTIEQLQEMIIKLQEVAAATGDAFAVEKLAEYKLSLAQANLEQNKMYSALYKASSSGLDSFFDDLISGTKTLGDAFRGLGLEFLKTLAKMVAEAIKAKLLGALAGFMGLGVGVPGLKTAGAGGGISRFISPESQFDFGSLDNINSRIRSINSTAANQNLSNSYSAYNKSMPQQKTQNSAKIENKINPVFNVNIGDNEIRAMLNTPSASDIIINTVNNNKNRINI